MAGVTEDEAIAITSTINMLIGTLPFKYLEVSLTSKRLNFAYCKPLIEKLQRGLRVRWLISCPMLVGCNWLKLY